MLLYAPSPPCRFRGGLGGARAKAGPRPGLQHGGGQVDPHGQIGGPPPQAGAWANSRPSPLSVKENKGVAWGEGEG